MSEWKSLETLRQSHQVGLQKMQEMEAAVQGLDGLSPDIAREQLKDMLIFFNTELRAHFLHEEEALFPVLSRQIGPMGPVAVMLAEHRSLWQAVDAMEEALEQMKHGGPQDIVPLRQVASHIVWSLRSHIQKEDEMLFPLAEAHLQEQGRQEVDYRMEGGPALRR